MSGLKIVLPTNFSDSTLPKLLDDPVFPQNGGALLLVEPGHPANPSRGVVGNGLVLPNIAASQAAALVGSGDANSLGATLTVSGYSGAYGLMERTLKGGLHGISSQTAITENGHYALLDIATLVKSYLLSHSTDDLFISMAHAVTRPGQRSTGNNLIRRFLLSKKGNEGSVYRTQFYTPATTTNAEIDGAQTATYPGGGFSNNLVLGSTLAQPWPAVQKRISIGTSDWAVASGQTLPTDQSGMLAHAIWGHPGSASNLGAPSGTGQLAAIYPSWILYWLYIENLTYSGRSYAQVEAADQAKFAKEFSAGGRYYGDTYTDPTLIP